MSPLLDDFPEDEKIKKLRRKKLSYFIFVGIVSVLIWICMGIEEFKILPLSDEDLIKIWVFACLFSGMWLCMRCLEWRFFAAFFMSVGLLAIDVLLLFIAFNALDDYFQEGGDKMAFIAYLIVNLFTVLSYIGGIEMLYQFKALRAKTR